MDRLLKQWIKRETRRENPKRWDYIKARTIQIVRDIFTRKLSDLEWLDVANNYPRCRKLYVRGIVTTKELARLYREEKACQSRNTGSKIALENSPT